MYVSNLTQLSLSIDSTHILKPGQRNVYYEDTPDLVSKLSRYVKLKQVIVRFSNSFLCIASESVLKNSIIHIDELTDVLYCRYAVNHDPTSMAHGFVLADCLAGEVIEVHLDGIIPYQDALVKDAIYYLGETAGSISVTAPVSDGHVHQIIGIAVTSDSLKFTNNGYEILGTFEVGDPGSTTNIRFAKYKKYITNPEDRAHRLLNAPIQFSEKGFLNGVYYDDWTVSNKDVIIPADLILTYGDIVSIHYCY